MRRPTQQGAAHVGPIPLAFMVPRIIEGQCFICQAENPQHETTLTTRVSFYVIAKIFVDPETRICPGHIYSSTLLAKDEYALLALETTEQIIRLTPDEIQAWFEEARQITLHFKNQELKVDDYMNSLPDEDFVIMFGITKENFGDLMAQISEYRSAKGMKCSNRSLMLFLLKLRQGHTLSYLKALFGYKTKGAVSHHIKNVRQALMQNFVPRHLGGTHITREEAMRHTTPLARSLYLPEGNEENIVVIIDGTYLYTPKSFNFTELKRTFSTHKGRHLIKMTMCVLADGYIIACPGPFYADSKNNDAATLTCDLREEISGLRTLLREGDVIIIDRGLSNNNNNN